MINNNLTAREQEVLKLVAQAKTNKEITEELFIADCTVDTHLHNIYRKLGLFATDKAQTSVLRLKTAMHYWKIKQQANKEYYNQKIKTLLTENEKLKEILSGLFFIMTNTEVDNG